MCTKGCLAAKEVSGKKERLTSSGLTHLRANGSRSWGLSAVGILVLLGACTSGRIAAGHKSDAASVVRRTKANPASTPIARGPQSEKILVTIRQELVDGEYSKAHQDLATLVQHDNQLSRAEQRELKDNLCLTEYLIGQGSYTLSEQERTCSAALAEPGSVSGALLARIHDSLKQLVAEEVRHALEEHNLAEAEAVALAYRDSPGADSELLTGWSSDFWQVVHGQERPPGREQRVTPLIAELTTKYPQAKMMSETDFSRWVIAVTAVPNKSIVSSLTAKGDTLDLLVFEHDLPAVVSNLYEFVRINDMLAARCGCDARTNVGVAELGFPVYLFRLDPEESTSKILIATGPPGGGAILPLARPPAQALTAKTLTVPPIELSRDASTDGKPGQGPASDGTAAITKGPPAPASLPQQRSSGRQAKPEPRASASRSSG
jgi:hypothetical protein